MKYPSLHRTACGVLSVSLGSLALLAGVANHVVAEETSVKQKPSFGSSAKVSHPDMQSVKDVSRYVETRRKRDAAVLKATTVARRKSTPVSKEQFKQLRGGMKLGKYEAWLERLRVRAYPNDRVNSNAYLTAMKKQAALPAAQISGTQANAGMGAMSQAMAVGPVGPAVISARGAKWEFIGPRNMTSPSPGGLGPIGAQINGRVNDVAYDPINPNIVYLCGAQGGVWKSVNGGRDWYALSDTFPMLSSSAIAISPGNTQIILAGLGDHHGGDNFGDIPGIMRSEDGGRSWGIVGQLMSGPASVSSLVFDPDSPSVAVAATGGGSYRFGAKGGIFYSTDAGKSWQPSTFETPPNEENGVDIRDVKVGTKDALGKRYYYAVNGGYVQEIYRSEDQGRTWRTFAAPIFGTAEGIEIAPSAVDPNVVYVADGWNRRVQKGTVNASGNIDWVDITGDIRNAWDQTFYDFYARAVPQRVDGVIRDVLYVGTLNVNGSLGAGSTWSDLTLTYTGRDTVHTDQHALAFNPLNANEMLLGNDGGVYGMTFNPVTKTWSFRTDIGKTIGVTQFYTADWHPTNPQVALGAAQDNSNPASLGNILAWRNVGFGDGMSCAINPTNPNIMFVCSQFEFIYRTGNGFAGNGGFNITPQYGGDEARPFVTISAIDPTFPHPYYVGTSYLWRWNENAQQWDARIGNTELASGGASVQCIAVAPSDPNRIYVGTNDARLWVSRDKGMTWRKVTDGALVGAKLPNRVITAVSVHPSNPDDILVTLSGTGSTHVYRSVNASNPAATFTALGGTGTGTFPDVPTTCIERIPGRPTTDFFVGTDIGVFYTSNGGATWQNATAPLGLPNVEVTALKATPRTGYLNVATYGRGMWRLPLGKLAGTRSGSL